eukprot:16446598-Heterocapsa_arctica.AAC.1
MVPHFHSTSAAKEELVRGVAGHASFRGEEQVQRAADEGDPRPDAQEEMRPRRCPSGAEVLQHEEQ